jgi:hypothetical protein
LLDEPLIRAIISDHTPEQLYSKTEEIREDLAMLQASVVPDPEAARYLDQAEAESRAKVTSPVPGVTAPPKLDSQLQQVSRHRDMSSATSSKSPDDVDVETAEAVEDLKETAAEGDSSFAYDIDELSNSDTENRPDAASPSIRAFPDEAYGPVDFLYEMFEHL